jgi:HAE1 family hydrophobic/amphiphilic exporter-1
VVRETPDGGTVRVRDVARMELGSQDYSVAGRFNGKPSAILATYQLPGSNAVDAAAAVNKLMAKMKERFPEDLDYVGCARYDALGHGRHEGNRGNALDRPRARDPGGYLFLQSWRATLIPLLAVPVSLVGTFVFFPLFGFSINTLSLFRLSAGNRSGGRRRHCRGRRRGAPH